MTARRLSQAISEGDGISVIVSVDGPDAARRALEGGAEALLVPPEAVGSLHAIRDATDLPLLAVLGPRDAVLNGADAWLVDVRDSDRTDIDALRERAGDACEVALRIESEDDLEMVLDAFDPEIVVLGVEAAGDGGLEAVLELLPAVPAGKLAIADVGTSTREDVVELERAGVDAVIVSGGNVAHLVGTTPPDV